MSKGLAKNIPHSEPVLLGELIKQVASLQKEVHRELGDISARMATKADVMRLDMALETSTRDLRQDMASKHDLDKAKEELLNDLRPPSKAFDKDARTLIDHGKRILRIERNLAIK
ncbi:hypothetical protein HY417_00530 [Candidatus Kaiserbacteria bacterium]|nr:hypothetical protein [Candidatus Kaiserbacteria bacterium]